MVRIGRKRRRKSAGSEKERKAAELERQGLALLNKESTQTDKKEDSKVSSNQILIPRRPKFSRSPRHPAAKSSNVLRLKIVSKKNEASCSKGLLKGKC
ncbi:uncharacterized protein LOC109822552 [Asparagus officinalis]|uniref:uncharacterized protein LOC109822552 n=1 Tax=Asparagus officinalis TaxID=4686 RepID=UPI00098E763F|nr:uncharacterized protein LOC109822552 [Asparagus officinalis]